MEPIKRYLGHLGDRIEGIGVNFDSDTHFLSWRLLGLSLLAALVIALWRNRGWKRPLRSLKMHLASKRFRRSLREDAGFYGVKMIFDPLWLMLLGFSVSRADEMATAGFSQLLASKAWLPTVTLPDPLGAIVLGLVAFLCADFAAYFSHRCYHRYEILWRLHIVHHSAQYLTPLTKYRIHPIQYLTDSVFRAVCIALGAGLFGVLFELKLGSTSKATTYVLVFFTHSAIGNLRHSHFWIDYGPRWSRWFMSPAMHQIHHSSLEKHANKNYGVCLSIWDRLGGSLYAPEKRERFPVGFAPHAKEAGLSMFQQLVRPLLIWKRFQ